jgi:farnesyl diphosphate synthase
VQALNVVTPEQKKILTDNYGQHDMKKVEKVKKLFRDINIEKIFHAYEEDSYAKIQALLKDVKDMPTEIFEFLLRKIYKRSK